MKTKQVTLNEAERLYVIPENGGYSCLGFDICEKRTVALARELAALNISTPQPEPVGTLARYEQYEKLVSIAHQINQKTGWRSKSELTPELIGLEGKRVEVVHRWEGGAIETLRFQVGKSGGWIPCHLALARRNVSGGPAVCLGKIESVRVIR